MTARKFRMMTAQESGIGGFLLLFVVTQVLSLGLVVWKIPELFAALLGPDAAIAARSEPAYVPIVIATATLEALGTPVAQTIRAIGYGVSWFLYWRSSERVRLTFAPASGMTEIPKTS